MKRILVPIDFSTPSLAALTQAVHYTANRRGRTAPPARRGGGAAALVHRGWAPGGPLRLPRSHGATYAATAVPDARRPRSGRGGRMEAGGLATPPTGPLSRPGHGRPAGGGDRPRGARPGSRPDHHGDARPQRDPALAAEERHGPGAPSGTHRRHDRGALASRCLEGEGDLDALFPALGLGQTA